LRALITGINGFAGSHLADFLLTQPGIQVFGECTADCDNIVHLDGRAIFIEGDLRNPDTARALLQETQPDRIYHLADKLFPGSWQDPWTTLEVNLRSEVNLLRSVVELKLATRILVIGSLEEIRTGRPRGDADHGRDALSSGQSLWREQGRPGSARLQYFLSHHLPIVRVRPSNHIGPRQGTSSSRRFRQADRRNRARPAGARDAGWQSDRPTRLYRRA